MGKNVFSSKVDPTEANKIKDMLEKDGFQLLSVDHAFWQARRDRVFITFYRSGQVVIQGKDAQLYAEKYLLSIKSQQQIYGFEKIDDVTNWIGTDESGKGDFFGPLVVAALYVDKKLEHKLWLLGVRDSKKIPDHKIIELARSIRKNFRHSVVSISPEQYNKLYQQYKNLNHLLAFAHAKAINNLVEKTNCELVITDKFGNERLVREAIDNSDKIRLVQINKGEENLAVAGAAILARDKFISSLDKLSEKYQMDFPPGASKKVIAAAQRFVEKYGKDRLESVAKLHFKTMESL